MTKGSTSPPSRRKRALSDEEQALWQAVAKSAKPLRRRRVAPAKVVEAAAEIVDPKPPAKPRPVVSATNLPLRPIAAKPAPPPLAPLGRRERSKLAKGRKAIDARIDLHGMTQAVAHRALIAFLHRAHGDGATFVLIITGKGRSSAMEGGVLRRQVPLWMGLPELRSLVVGFEEAHIGHGGEGALYVRLRRSR
jgi:DNA-nicking Smr family endonuclease